MPGAFEAGVKALARKELSRLELVERLGRAGFARDEAQLAVDQLAEAGYQSDGRAAAERARALAARRYGDRHIRADLRSRGISAEEIDLVLTNIVPEVTRANQLAIRATDPERLARTLRRKGYTEDTLEAALQNAGRQG